ncbi:GerAB/ArcD/ProY family transporter [Bacillus horti]|uniref:Spore germination protein n=1 Tax=Caldalkalibacillus horti TaxID=77523 RepID=A0ABT9W4U7_9BACI|nr:GerAB/ArcD/ProY family transporter [Bacillus horti]MDQ0168273.1 spore germination protein [Bacillus horti]
MFSDETYRISPLELCITLIGMVLGVGVLTLPKVLAQALGTPDGWISVLISSLLAMLIILLFVRLAQHFPQKNILQILEYAPYGKLLSMTFGILFVLYFLGVIAFEGRVLATVVKIYLLVETPTEIILALVFLTVAYATSKGLQGLIHLNLLFVPICTLVLFGIVLLNMKDFSLGELLPIMPNGVTPILLGLKESSVSFLGLEIIFFLAAYMRANRLKAAPLNVSLSFLALLYLIVTLLCFSVFSVEATKIIVFPTVELAKEVEIAGGIFERLESLLITVWIITIFSTVALSTWLTYTILQKQFFKKSKRIWLIAFVSAITYFLSFLPQSITQAFILGERISFLGICLICFGLAAGYMALWRNKSLTH